MSRCEYSTLHWVIWCDGRKYDVKEFGYELPYLLKYLSDIAEARKKGKPIFLP